MSDRIPDGFTELQYSWAAPGQKGEILTSYGINESVSATDAIADDLTAAFGNLSFGCSSSVTVTSCTFVQGQSSGDDLSTGLALSQEGGQDETMFPVNCATLLQKRTLTGGRRGRGRMYLPGVPEGKVTNDGNYDPAEVLLWAGRINDFVDATNTAGVEIVLLHQTAPFSPSIVTSWGIVSLIANQRGRLR